MILTTNGKSYKFRGYKNQTGPLESWLDPRFGIKTNDKFTSSYFNSHTVAVLEEVPPDAVEKELSAHVVMLRKACEYALVELADVARLVGHYIIYDDKPIREALSITKEL